MLRKLLTGSDKRLKFIIVLKIAYKFTAKSQPESQLNHKGSLRLTINHRLPFKHLSNYIEHIKITMSRNRINFS